MILDGRNRFTEGGQVIRRDGWLLRSEKRGTLHLTRPDSHHVVQPQPERHLTGRETATIIALVLMLTLGAVFAVHLFARIAEDAIPLFGR